MLNLLTRKRRQEQDELEEFIAHEIHDGACQYAIAAQMAFQTYRREKRETVPENWKNFDTGMAFLDNAIDELRRLICGLQPIQLSAGGLEAAIACLIKEIQSGRPRRAIPPRHRRQSGSFPSTTGSLPHRAGVARQCLPPQQEPPVTGSPDSRSEHAQRSSRGLGSWVRPRQCTGRTLRIGGDSPTDQAVGRYSGHPQPTG